MPDAYVLDGLRTPFGKHGGGLAGVRPDDLAAFCVRQMVDRYPELVEQGIDEVLFGNANGAGEENRNVARMAVLLAGLPTSIPASTTNRLCGSSLDTAIQAARAIETGDAELVLTGGVESMSRAPWVVPKPERAFPRGPETMHSTTLGWRLVNPEMPTEYTVSLGEGAEILAQRYSIDRRRQEAYALRSHQRAADAWDAGVYDEQVVPVPGTELTRDETIRPDTSLEQLAKLPPAFAADGTVTAGTASPLNDGAGAVLIGSAEAAARLGRRPMARIAGRGASGLHPEVYGLGPLEASEIALRRAGISWDDINVIELNEAFAAQVLACLAEWTDDVDPEIVNVNGGAVALGHPLGASGARILTMLAYELARRGGGWGLATLCIGVGQGLAVVLEA